MAHRAEDYPESAGNTWHWWEVMAHGNLVDRPSGGGPTRRGGLGLLSLALVGAARRHQWVDVHARSRRRLDVPRQGVAGLATPG